MIFLIAPDQEGLGIVVVDTTSTWPEAAGIGGLEEAIALFEQEVIIDELLLNGLFHTSERVELALELTLETRQSGGNLLFHFLVLGLSEAWIEGVAFHGAATAHTSGDHKLASRIEIAEGVYITKVAWWMLVRLLESCMVVLNDGIEEVREYRVRLSIRSIDTNTRIVILES